MFKLIFQILPILIFSFSSCSRKFASQLCKPYETINKKIDLVNGDSKIINLIGKSYLWDSSKNSQIIDSIFINENEFQNYFNSICNDNKNTGKFLSILYVNKFANQNDKIDTSNISAIGMYYYNRKYYDYKLFIKKSGDYIEEKELTTKTFGVTNSSINDIGENIIFRSRTNYTLILVTKKSTSNFYDKMKSDFLFDKIQNFKKIHYTKN